MMQSKIKWVVGLLCIGLAACTTTVKPGGLEPELKFFSHIKVPEGHEAVLRLRAQGAQLFRCERLGLGSKWSYGWIYRQPEADLFDATGRFVGSHGANFTFEHNDGSLLVGRVLGHDEAARTEDLPWLLLATRAHGQGAFAKVDYVQRVNTRGGMPPQRCSPNEQNQLLRVGFSADFIFYKPR